MGMGCWLWQWSPPATNNIYWAWRSPKKVLMQKSQKFCADFKYVNLKIELLQIFEKKSFSSLFLMRKPLSSDQKWFLRPYFPLIGSIFVLKSGLRFLFRALEVPIRKVRKSHFLSWKRVFSSLSEWALPMPETKIWDHFSIQIYPLLVGNMASETTFGHWKVVFSWGKGRKMTFSQNPLISRFWASGFWMSILSSVNFKKDPPWNIFCLSLHAPAIVGNIEIGFSSSLCLIRVILILALGGPSDTMHLIPTMPSWECAFVMILVQANDRQLHRLRICLLRILVDNIMSEWWEKRTGIPKYKMLKQSCKFSGTERFTKKKFRFSLISLAASKKKVSGSCTHNFDARDLPNS